MPIPFREALIPRLRAVFALALLLGGMLWALRADAEGGFRWRGAPPPKCTSSLIMEAGPRIGTDEIDHDMLGYSLALGYTRNAPPGKTGWGGVAQVTTSTEGGTYLVTLMPRARRWLGSGVAIDYGAGIALIGPGESPVGLKGMAASAAVNFSDLVSITGGVDYEFPQGSYAARTSFTIGLRFDSYLALPVGLAPLALYVLALGGSD
jgi:hypothetical protein